MHSPGSVDRLLDSPRYGERWGRHWLDVARYSDTKGYVYGREERFLSFTLTPIAIGSSALSTTIFPTIVFCSSRLPRTNSFPHGRQTWPPWDSILVGAASSDHA
jgi:hypothetical protein